jgi:hypothetical protein
MVSSTSATRLPLSWSREKLACFFGIRDWCLFCLESQTLIIGRREIEILISEAVVEAELLKLQKSGQFPDDLVKIEDAKIHCVVSHVLAITSHKGDRSARSFKQAVSFR